MRVHKYEISYTCEHTLARVYDLTINTPLTGHYGNVCDKHRKHNLVQPKFSLFLDIFDFPCDKLTAIEMNLELNRVDYCFVGTNLRNSLKLLPNTYKQQQQVNSLLFGFLVDEKGCKTIQLD